jgi:hypothetical protein
MGLALGHSMTEYAYLSGAPGCVGVSLPPYTREIPTLTGGTGMTDARICHPVGVSPLCRAAQRDGFWQAGKAPRGG